MTNSLPLILAECLAALEHGSTVEQCLARYPQHRNELAELLMAAQHLKDAPNARPSPEFQRVARARLMNRLPPRQSARPWLNALAPVTLTERLRSIWQTITHSSRRSAMRWIALGLVVVTLLGSATAASASSQALPGDSLYGVKRAVESVRLALALSAADSAQLRVQFAQRRLTEAQALLQRGDDTQALFESYTAEMNGLALVWPRVAEPQRASLQTDLAWQADSLAALDVPGAEAALEAMNAVLATSNGWPVAQPTLGAAWLPVATATPSPSQIKPTLAVTIRATAIVTGLPTWVPAVPNYCWPANWPTPEKWPTSLPTPNVNCTPGPWPTPNPTGLPVPTQICWPPDVPTPDPSHWPPNWPAPDTKCWPTPWPTPNVGATLTQIVTRIPPGRTPWPTPDMTQILTRVPTQYATYIPPVVPTVMPPVITPPNIPTIVVPTDWATYRPPGLPTWLPWPTP
jgi:hypothetical protein